MLVKRKYVDSHWLVFAVQGVISILFGWFAAFTSERDLTVLVAIVGSTLLGLGIIELFNLLRRTHLRETWGLSFAIALIEVAVAFTLLFTAGADPVFHLAVIAGYTVLRGVFEILVGLRSIDDSTDRFIWCLSGICGAIMGFAILNSGAQGAGTFIKFFGAYMMLAGVAQLIYGAHNREQSRMYKDELKNLRSAKPAAKKPAAKKTSAKSAAAKKTAAKRPAKKSAAKRSARR